MTLHINLILAIITFILSLSLTPIYSIQNSLNTHNMRYNPEVMLYANDNEDDMSTIDLIDNSNNPNTNSIDHEYNDINRIQDSNVVSPPISIPNDDDTSKDIDAEEDPPDDGQDQSYSKW
eukprot:CAMPEP_0201578196 /NCGR_PEP_ID=MMETSP0190_2-20130828/24970_1 /ASSEMBLY_ACC=CAM_ASM_000263 /TAXON_ID=37353 /ORGANISM="Rosalina sp." /LENGTH=119 /DNA_ID=CAMNT_0048011117 /DNA_START=133 /DNA_END=489 /DNA_ORIENTATION=-